MSINQLLSHQKNFVFRVNHNPENIDEDKFHDFTTLKGMRDYIDDHIGEPMEISVHDENDECLIATSYNCYWVGDKHPTLSQLLYGLR